MAKKKAAHLAFHHISEEFLSRGEKPQNITKAGLEGCHTDTGCCQACSLHQAYHAFYQPAPNTKLQNHQEHQLVMPKYLLTAPTVKRALTPRKKQQPDQMENPNL